VTIDILFLAQNREAFTAASLQALADNTDWSLVNRLLIFARDCVHENWSGPDNSVFYATRMFSVAFDSPASAINAYVRDGVPGYYPWITADCFAKIDNDVIVPPGWLTAAAAVMEKNPQLDLLGLEGPLSRTPYDPVKNAPPESNPAKLRDGYATCDSIGGVGLMRTSAFLRHEPIVPHSIYGGFGEWQRRHADISKGWIVPPINLFVLDRLPMEPWASLSAEYERQGLQRHWPRYPLESHELWDWWVK